MSKLIEKYNALKAEANQLFETAKNAGLELTAEQNKRKDEIFKSMEGIKAQIEDEKKLATMTFNALENKEETQVAEKNTKNDRENYNKYLRTGDMQFTATGAITTGTGTGALLPTTIGTPVTVRRMYNSILAVLGAYNVPVIETDDSATFGIPVLDDSLNAGQISNQDVSGDTVVAPTPTQLTLAANLYDSKSIWLSNTLVNANGFDLVSYILPILDKRIEIAQDTAWITKLLAKSVTGNTVTTAATTAITYDEFIGFFHKLVPQYRVDGAFIVSDAFYQTIRTLKDDQKRPLLTDSVVAGAPAMLQGKPLFISNNMEAVAAGKIPAAFVSAEALKARLVKNRRIARYVDNPAYPDQVGFREFVNGDFDVVSAGVAFLKMAAA